MGPYGETRWGLQAMETVQKIVDSGVALSQRVSHHILLHSHILLFRYLSFLLNSLFLWFDLRLEF